MKKQLILFALLCYGTFATAQPFAAQLKNNIQKGMVSDATVYISARFNLDSSLMFWAPESASRSCRGVLIEGYKMAAPVSCFQKTGYRLNSLYYMLSNGQRIIDDPKSLVVKGDMAYVSLANVKSSLRALPFLPVNYSASKKEITRAFQSFLAEHHVHHLKHGRNRAEPDKLAVWDGNAIAQPGRAQQFTFIDRFEDFRKSFLIHVFPFPMISHMLLRLCYHIWEQP